ncbi:MAG TPA: hypothetical protein VK886_13945 [Vicinamibacterales bacterium]|nr:hypothetical protein [Vicinamibacterales bacterium]
MYLPRDEERRRRVLRACVWVEQAQGGHLGTGGGGLADRGIDGGHVEAADHAVRSRIENDERAVGERHVIGRRAEIEVAPEEVLLDGVGSAGRRSPGEQRKEYETGIARSAAPSRDSRIPSGPIGP